MRKILALYLLLSLTAHADEARLKIEGAWLAHALMQQCQYTPWEREGDGLTIHALRPAARPGDRYAEVLIDSPHGGAGVLRLELLDFRTGELLALRVEHNAEYPMLVQADLRGIRINPPSQYLLRASLTVDGVEVGCSGGVLYADSAPRWDSEGPVELTLSLPEGFSDDAARVLTFGVPFPAGGCWSPADLRLEDNQGRAVPAQWEVTGWWGEDGSIKWARADALISLDAERVLLKSGAPDPLPDDVSPVTVIRHTATVYEVHHDAYRYLIGPGKSPLHMIYHEDIPLVDFNAGRGMFVVDQQGRVGAGTADAEMMVESEGPLAVSLRLEGDYRTATDERLARYIVRLEFFAGQPGVKVTHTLVLSESTREIWFREVGWEGVPKPAVTDTVHVGLADAQEKFVWQSNLDDNGGEWMAAQIEYPSFRRGVKQAVVWQVGAAESAWNGETLGDWAGMTGARHALFWIGQDMARQSPKSYRMGRDIFALDLYSAAAETELDFRAPAMVARWRLAEWLPQSDRTAYTKKTGGDLLEKIAEYEIDARGWAKTHEFRVVPASADSAPDIAAREADLMTDPVFAVVSPQWIYHTRVVGAIHPRDSQRFPDAESFADAAFDRFYKNAREGGFDGFIDYWTGPTYSGVADRARRYRFAYTLRADIWRYYLRSGDRRAREFAVNANRAFMDTILAHWTPAQGERGLFFYNYPHGEFRDATTGALPFVGSDSPTRIQMDGSSNLDQYWLLYQVTGYRRAREAMAEFARGALALKHAQDNPDAPVTGGRRLIELRVWAQLYSYLHDNRLRKAAADVTGAIYAPGAALKNMATSDPTYKISSDMRGPLTAWEVFGTEPFKDMADGVCNYIWEAQAANFPVFYVSAIAQAGHWLWEQTGNPMYPQGLAFLLRWSNAAYNPDSERISLQGRLSVSTATYPFEGIPLMQDALARTHADRQPLTSWLAFAPREGDPVKVYLARRQTGEHFSLRNWVPVRNAVVPWPDAPILETILPAPDARAGPKNIRLSQINDWRNLRFQSPPFTSNAFLWQIPADVPQAVFALDVSRAGEQYHLADYPVPLVVEAPRGFELYALKPGVKIIFNLRGNEVDPAVFVDRKYRLLTPQDEVWGGEQDVLKDWTSLPADLPGLWVLELLEGDSNVNAGFRAEDRPFFQTRNIYPVFAMDSRDFWFDPTLSP